jgi:integrase
MGRRRKKYKGLPPRVTWKNGAHYFTPFIDGKLKYIWLGRSDNPEIMSEEATLAWRRLSMENDVYANTMDYIFDHYMREVSPTKAKSTHQNNAYKVKNLRAVFGHMRPEAIKPSHIYKYQDMRSQAADVAPNREIALLSSCFVTAIKKGWINDNPCRLVKRLYEKPRDRYVEDWEFRAVYNIANVTVRCAMMIAYQSTQRRGDILMIRKEADLRREGVYVRQGKRGKKILIQWNDALRKAVDILINFRGHFNSEYLFVNRYGKKLTASGFSTLWQKTITKALELKLIEERFTFHDFKPKSVSDDKSGHESVRAGHSSEEITRRVYKRGYEEVSALIRPTDILSVGQVEEIA